MTPDAARQILQDALQCCRHHARPGWSIKVFGIAVKVAKTKELFTVDDIYTLMEKLDLKKKAPPNLDGIGSVITILQRMGCVEPAIDADTGRQKTKESVRKAARQRPQRVWRSKIYVR